MRIYIRIKSDFISILRMAPWLFIQALGVTLQNSD